jgi:alkylation response protein AidB-like acyl-CoA dehydrogenase
MNLELTDEQALMVSTAREMLLAQRCVVRARERLEGGPPPDLWRDVAAAGWPGMLIEADSGGAGLGIYEAILVLQEAGAVLGMTTLGSHLPAASILEAASYGHLAEIAAGATRAVYLPARPPIGDEVWTVDAAAGRRRLPAPRIGVSAGQAVVSGFIPWVAHAEFGDLLVVVGMGDDGPLAAAVDVSAPGVMIELHEGYDPTTPLSHVSFDRAPGVPCEVKPSVLAGAWYLAQALLAAESVGAARAMLDMARDYARRRIAFGRPIGSYQALKHGMVEMHRWVELAGSLLIYAAWADAASPHELPLAASAARSVASRGCDFAAWQNLVVHGGIGFTWEHDAHLYYRRAQVSRRLLGGVADSSRRVAVELLDNKSVTKTHGGG